MRDRPTPTDPGASPSAPPRLTLESLEKGAPGRVVTIDAPSAHERSKLMALGLTPHSEVTVLQRFPSIVVEVGYTQIALDAASARSVVVELGEPDQR